MGYRRSSAQTKAERAWAGFVDANLKRLEAAGLPLLASRSVDHWDRLLMQGHFDHHEDPSHFQIESLTDDQYSVFVDLVESYFLAGYEYFTPLALKIEDQDRLGSRFGS